MTHTGTTAQLRRLAVAVTFAIVVTVTVGLVAVWTLPARAEDASTGHDPAMPGPGGTKDVPTLVAHRRPPADPRVPAAAPIPAALAVHYGAEAGIDPRLLLAIIANESGIPHGGLPDGIYDLLDRLRGKEEGPSRGVAAMKLAPFTEVQKAHPDLFGGYSFEDVSTDPVLAVRALAWKLSDIENGRDPNQRLPESWNPAFKRDEILAMAWNDGLENVMTFINGGKFSDDPKADQDHKNKIAWYKDHIDQNWAAADQNICGSDTIYVCSL